MYFLPIGQWETDLTVMGHFFTNCPFGKSPFLLDTNFREVINIKKIN